MSLCWLTLKSVNSLTVSLGRSASRGRAERGQTRGRLHERISPLRNRLQRCRRKTRNRVHLLKTMVGERGFEPPTPWSRTRCSTRLSHSPTVSPLILLHVIRHVLIWTDRLVGTIWTTAQFFCRVFLAAAKQEREVPLDPSPTNRTTPQGEPKQNPLIDTIKFDTQFSPFRWIHNHTWSCFRRDFHHTPEFANPSRA